MKIVHFHPHGRMAAQFITPLQIAERAAGHESLLVTSLCLGQQEEKVIPFDLSVRNLFGLPVSLWKVCSLLKRVRPEVVFSHNTKSSLLPLLGAWLAGVQVRVYFNHGVPHVGYKGLLRSFLRMLERLNCSLATTVVTVSKDMQLILQSELQGVQAQIILNGSASGIDLNTFSFGRYCRADWRQAHGLREDDFVAIYLGRPERRKGFELVLKLWADNFREDRLKLVLCGPTQADVLKILPALPANVICLGFIHNVPEVLACSDILILPSLHEGLSYAVMEAQASGLVVVANDIKGIQCLIENGVSGYLVKDNSLQDYAEIIYKIEQDRVSLANMRQCAIVSVAKFSRDLFIPAYISFLNRLLKDKT
jgi:N,N'-diacetylbacillosaminyl-diphospho-undecaprenol alpha-1,3-N-acetylgalactosaminyltransferase